jgi:glutamate-1-semialdehyde 2,1-aminomutase
MTTELSSRSLALFERAQEILPGGVSSPVRAFGAVGGYPRFIRSGSGSKLIDVDGNEYVDMVMSWGPLLHGHAHPEIVAAIQAASAHGTTFGAPTEIELLLATRIRDAMPSVEMLRFVSSGTEATMSALRVARGFTGRDIVVKFDGCYHGHVDALLIKAGSGALTHGRPTSAGISASETDRTRGLPYNDSRAAMELFDTDGSSVAAVIVEPVAGNMGTVPPEPGFLETLRRLCDGSGALLIFDEVITGFRLAMGGAQALFDVKPDLTCLGKIVGGGLPAAAFGGRRDVMELLSPLGPVYQAGTLSGNPVAMAAGHCSLGLAQGEDYGKLSALAAQLHIGLTAAAERHGIEVSINREQSMLSIFFAPGPVRDLSSAQTVDAARYARFFHAMLDRGVYLPPSQFETWILSFAHSEDDVAKVVDAADDAFATVDGN